MSVELIKAEVELIVAASDMDASMKITRLKQIEQEKYKPLIREFAYKKTADELGVLANGLEALGYLTTKLAEYSYALYLVVSQKDLIEDGQLSKTTLKCYDDSLKYYTDVAVFYQYVITMINEKIDPLHENAEYIVKLDKLHYELTKVKQNIISISKNTSLDQGNATIEITPNMVAVVKDEIGSHKAELIRLRKYAETKVEEIENYRLQSQSQSINDPDVKIELQHLYVNEARSLFETIAKTMKGFLARLYTEAEQEIGKPPCSYSVMGLGSLALNQATPYSDLEFAILTANEDYKQSKDPQIREYFRNLTHLVHFKVINLGETTIPTSKYGLDLDHLVHKGVNFDLGGKTTLGRIDKLYSLIQTIEEMLCYVHNEDNYGSSKDKNLPYILEKACYIYGDGNLLNNYQYGVAEFLHSRVSREETRESTEIHDSSHDSTDNLPHVATQSEVFLNCEARAVKLLNDGMIEINYESGSIKPIEIQVKGDLEKLPPLSEDDGKLFEVKQEIYRLPDRLLYNLGLYYGIQGDSSWDTVDQLYAQSIIREEAALHLKYAVTFATTLRLKTYLHNKGQRETILTSTSSYLQEGADGNVPIDASLRLPENDTAESSALFKYFYTSLPLYIELKKFCDQYQTLNVENKHNFFNTNQFYLENDANKGLIYYRLGQYQEARKSLEKAVKSKSNFENRVDLQIKYSLGNIYNFLGLLEEAIQQFEYCLNIEMRIYHDTRNPIPLAACYNNLGVAYKTKGEYGQALKYHIQSLTMREYFYDNKPHPDIAASFNNLGTVYKCIGDYDKAILYYNKSLEMKKILYKNEEHLSIASSLDNLGLAYRYKGKSDQAIKYHAQSLEMRQLIYKEEPQIEIAACLNNLGIAYSAKNEHDIAIGYYLQSLRMYQYLLKNAPHLDVAGCLNNLGLSHMAKGEYDLAIEWHTQSLKMKQELYYAAEDTGNADIAMSFNSVGAAYKAARQYDQSIEYFEKSIQQWQSIYHMPHPNIAMSLNNLAAVHVTVGNYSLAIKYNAQALKMISLFRDSPYRNVIEDNFKSIAIAFANVHSLDDLKIKHKMYLAAMQELDFTNYKVHYSQALSLQLNRIDQLEQLLLLYKLASIFVPLEATNVKKEIDSNLITLTGMHPHNFELWLAVKDKNLDLVRKLLKTEIDINVSIQGKTPLIQAIISGDEDMVLALIAANADINEPNLDEATPLYCSLGYYGQQINLAVVELLLQHHANPNIPMNDWDTPMHMAHYRANPEAIRLLLQYQANINAQNHKGQTPLHCLLEKQDIVLDTKIQIIEEFLSKYDLPIQDLRGKTVIDYAAEYCPETLSILLSDVANDGSAQQQEVLPSLVIDFIIESNDAPGESYVDSLGES